ncbi:MAG TPA: FISUMP domain-containing protein [Steroidobacteraceae bacterium]|nr:FISUMP domain-containing protein [Steroidobacteraceae bacterium]
MRQPAARGTACMALCGLLTACAIAPPADSDALVDARDGRTYRTARIGAQHWLTQNAMFAGPGSWCFGDEQADCDINGRLYTWEGARQACPDGARLPSDEDWIALEVALGMTPEDASKDRARGTQGARLRRGGDSGFDAPISGYRRPDGSYVRRGERAAYWTSSETNAEDAWHRDVRSDVDTIYRSPVTKTYALSVRCVVHARGAR